MIGFFCRNDSNEYDEDKSMADSDNMYQLLAGLLMKNGNIVAGFFWACFDERYWVVFSMAKSMSFPQFQGENPNSKNKKISPFLTS